MGRYGISGTHVNLPTVSRGCLESWVVVVRETAGRINGVTLGSDSLLLIPPSIEFEHQDEGGWGYGVDTDGETIQALIGERTLPGCVVDIPIDPQHGERLRSLIRRELAGDQVEGGILGEALKHFDVKPENLITSAREWIACRARDAIDARLRSNVCLSDVCRIIRVSVRTAERAFRICFQETMSGYIRRSRLDQAKDLLLTGIPVTDAAMEVGWNHLGRFSVEFKKRFGESPSEMRKRHQSRFSVPLLKK